MITGHQLRKENREANGRVLARAVRSSLGEFAAALVTGVDGAGVCEVVLGDMITALCNGRQLTEIKARRRELRRQLIGWQGKTTGEIALPDPEFVLHRAPSPMRPACIRHAIWVSELQHKFHQELLATSEVSDAMAAEHIMCSAIVNGGLLAPQLIECLPDAITTSLFWHGGHYWIDLYPAAPKKFGGVVLPVRRWFPDPVTLSLICRWRLDKRTWPEGNAGRVNAVVRRLTKRLDVTNRYGISAKQLASRAQMLLRLRLPAYLVDFLASTDAGYSLEAGAWWRLVAGVRLAPSVADDSAPADGEEVLNQAVVEQATTPLVTGKKQSGNELATLHELRECLRAGRRPASRADALRAISALQASAQQNSGELVMALVDWAAWLLDSQRRGVSAVKTQSVDRYLASFAQRMLMEGGEIPLDADPDSFEALYEKLLAGIQSQRSAEYAAGRLADFHRFLVSAHRVAPAAIDGVTDVMPNVRTNIVSERECRYARDLILRFEEDPRTQEMLQIMLSVAFRLGLRRSELLYLRIADLQGSEGSLRPLVRIRSHRKSGLKNLQSGRRMPLAHLMPDAELKELRKWAERRRIEFGRNKLGDALLFCARGRDFDAIPAKFVDVITTSLRFATGDESVVLHTLRHSFLTMMFAQLVQDDLQHWDGHDVWAQHPPAGSPTCSLARRLLRTEYLTADAGYVLAELGGHKGPAVTLRTYTHLQDWAAGRYLTQLCGFMGHPLGFWSELEGINVATLRVRRSRNVTGAPHLDTPDRLVRNLRLVPPDSTPAIPISVGPPPLPTTVEVLRGMSLADLYSALAIMDRNMLEAAREKFTGLPHACLESLQVCATRVASAKTSSRNISARRQKLVQKRPARDCPPLSQRPQLDGVAPAPPTDKVNRREAEGVFNRALHPRNGITAGELRLLLIATSINADHSIGSRSIGELAEFVVLLERLGVPKERLQFVILSLPKSLAVVNVDDWVDEVIARVGIQPAPSVTESKHLPRTNSARKYPEGRVCLDVIESYYPSADLTKESDHEPRRAHGWRVGCYYAYVALMAIEELGRAVEVA